MTCPFAQDALAQAQILFATFAPLVQAIFNRFKTDMTLVGQMDLLEEAYAAALLRRITDTGRLAKYEAWTAAIALYKVIEAGAEMGMPGYQAAYDILKARFAGQGGNQPQPNP
jgi:hypothetical protein